MPNNGTPRRNGSHLSSSGWIVSLLLILRVLVVVAGWSITLLINHKVSPAKLQGPIWVLFIASFEFAWMDNAHPFPKSEWGSLFMDHKVVVVVVLVLDNNNKNAEADPSTLFCRLSFNSLKMWHNGDGLLYYCGPRWVATSTVTSLAARSCPTMVPHVKTAVCWNLILLVGMNCLVVVGTLWLGVGTPIFVVERWLHDGR